MRMSDCHPDRKHYCRGMCLRCYEKTYRDNNRDLCNSRTRRWRIQNPEQANSWGKRNPERNRQNSSSWAKLNPNKVRKSYKKWAASHPDTLKNKSQKRRALEKSAIIENCADKMRLLRKERFCHWYCVKLCQPKLHNPKPNDRTIDHVIPLSRKGGHIPDNLVAACAFCNSSKKDKLVHEWTWKPNEVRIP